MVNWELFTTTHLPIYDYAPDVRVCGDYLYFCASSHDKGIYYRTTDPFSDTYETFDGAFPFWDPNLFVDDDGRFYFFWGSSTSGAFVWGRTGSCQHAADREKTGTL